MLKSCVTEDAELVDPTGRWQGVAGLAERIGRYQSAAPDTEVVTPSGVDAHSELVRYAWKIIDRQGHDGPPARPMPTTRGTLITPRHEPTPIPCGLSPFVGKATSRASSLHRPEPLRPVLAPIRSGRGVAAPKFGAATRSIG